MDANLRTQITEFVADGEAHPLAGQPDYLEQLEARYVKALDLLVRARVDHTPDRYDPDNIKTWDDERIMDAIQPLIFTWDRDKPRVRAANERYRAELHRRGYERG